jgi:hypothetical protein
MKRIAEPTTDVIHVLIRTREDGETFAIVFPASRKADAIREMGRMASNPELAFTWYDASVMATKARECV